MFVQPSKAGGLYEHLRQTAAHNQQRGAAMYGGMTTTKGFVPNRSRKAPVPTPGKVEQFRLIRQYRDHIVCARWTADLSEPVKYNGVIGSRAAEEVRISKFYEGRVSQWAYEVVGDVDGFQYYDYNLDGSERKVRLVDGALYGAESVIWTEEVVPKYVNEKSTIYASKIVQGKIQKVQEVPGGPYYDVEFVELNARVWMPKHKKIRVCVEGGSGAWFTLIRTSESFQEE
jgi:hypothetical protein